MRSWGITRVGFEQKDTWNRRVIIYRTDRLSRGNTIQNVMLRIPGKGAEVLSRGPWRPNSV